jgi:hypothetical protein
MIDSATSAPSESIVQSLDTLTTSAGLSTQHNKVLPNDAPVPSIPVRVGSALSAARIN